MTSQLRRLKERRLKEKEPNLQKSGEWREDL